MTESGDPLRALGKVLKRAGVKLSARDLRTFLLAHAERLTHTPGQELNMDFVLEAEALLEALLAPRHPTRRVRRVRVHLLQ